MSLGALTRAMIDKALPIAKPFRVLHGGRVLDQEYETLTGALAGARAQARELRPRGRGPRMGVTDIRTGGRRWLNRKNR